MQKEVPTVIKWAGGKKQLLPQFKKHFPTNIPRYFEPFLGGGAIAFHVIKSFRPKETFLSDINSELINCYQIIKENPEQLIQLLKEYKKQHNKEAYYRIREQMPTTQLERAARFIYLNKTCFNGLYRVNSCGNFNVPMGSYKNPTVCPENEIRAISALLKTATIREMPFQNILGTASKDDFVYLDPPYYPLKKGKNFTTYAKENFLEKEQELLAQVFRELDKKGCKIMLSNSDTDFIRQLYNGYNIHVVKAHRMINSDGKGRGEIKELLIKNF